MADRNKQQAAPQPPMPSSPFVAPTQWPTMPHGTFNGLGITPPAQTPSQDEGDARRTPTAGMPGIAMPGSTAILGRHGE